MTISWASLVCIPVAAVLTEILARWFLRRQNRYYVWAPHYRMDMHIDHNFLPRLSSLVRFICNSDGERGYKVPRGCDRLFRVLVTGGSPAECGLSDQDDSWPILLQEILRDPKHLKELGASHVHVGNIARSGMDAQALDLVLQHVLPAYRDLDLIIVMVGGSNVLNWMKACTPVDQEYRWPDPRRFLVWRPDGPFSWKPRYTALAEVVRRVRQYVIKPVEKRFGVGKSLNRARNMRANASEVRNSTADPQKFLQNYERALRSSLEQARSSAARVLVVRQPWFHKLELTSEEERQLWNCSVGDPFTDHCVTYYSHEVMCRLMHLIDETTVHVCEESGIDHMSVQDALEPCVENYYDHLHFTPRGCAILGQEIAPKVVSLFSTSSRRGQQPIRLEASSPAANIHAIGDRLSDAAIRSERR